MADTAPELWCLIEGDTIPFSVPASDVFIARLKEMIKEKSPLFRSVYAMNLVLWKPREEISMKPSKTLA